MSVELTAGARLYAVIGEAVHDLPPRFVSRLEGILKAQEDAQYAGHPAVPSVSQQSGHINGGKRAHLMMIERKLSGLDAILEILHAAHIDAAEGADEPVIGEHLVEGLLVAGRDLLKTSRDALNGAL